VNLGRTEKSVKLVAVRKKLLSWDTFGADPKNLNTRATALARLSWYQPTASDSSVVSSRMRLRLVQRKTYKFMKPLTLV